MKLNGKKLEPRRKVIAFPGEVGERVFIVKAILDDEKFLSICPEPIPPQIDRGEGVFVPHITDKKYIAKMADHSKLRSLWLMLESLSDTPGLEWEQVKLEDPTTWNKFYDELKESGLTMFEQSKLVNAIMDINIVTDEAIGEATKAFLATKSRPAKK